MSRTWYGERTKETPAELTANRFGCPVVLTEDVYAVAVRVMAFSTDAEEVPPSTSLNLAMAAAADAKLIGLPSEVIRSVESSFICIIKSSDQTCVLGVITPKTST